MNDHVHHGFDYIEIPTNDIDASEAFYRSAFGWASTTFTPSGPCVDRKASVFSLASSSGRISDAADARQDGPLAAADDSGIAPRVRFYSMG